MTGGPRILVVEDDDETRRALVRELSARGYGVEEAGDGAEGAEEVPGVAEL